MKNCKIKQWSVILEYNSFQKNNYKKMPPRIFEAITCLFPGGRKIVQKNDLIEAKNQREIGEQLYASMAIDTVKEVQEHDITNLDFSHEGSIEQKEAIYALEQAIKRIAMAYGVDLGLGEIAYPMEVLGEMQSSDAYNILEKMKKNKKDFAVLWESSEKIEKMKTQMLNGLRSDMAKKKFQSYEKDTGKSLQRAIYLIVNGKSYGILDGLFIAYAVKHICLDKDLQEYYFPQSLVYINKILEVIPKRTKDGKKAFDYYVEYIYQEGVQRRK